MPRAPEGGQPSLPVGTLPVDGIPRDGEEYLAMVRAEAQNAPSILVHAMEEAPLATPAPQPGGDARMPTHAWCTVFVERFKRLRYSVRVLRPTGTVRARIPGVHEESRWYAYVHGRAAPNEDERQHMLASGAGSDSESEVSELLDAHDLTAHGYRFREPSLAVLAQLDTREAVALTKLFRKWMQHAQFTQGDAVLHPVHARWLFGLLACLDDDVSGEDMASLRVLARACIKCLVRARQQSTQHEGGAWMILAVLAGVCGQRDLWDEAQARLGPGGGGPA